MRIDWSFLCVVMLFILTSLSLPALESKSSQSLNKGTTWDQNTISSQERDQFFLESKIEPLISKLDEVDRDRLWVRARKNKMAELKKLYPNIPEAKLKLLQSRAKKNDIQTGSAL